jgi:hypothetical protein
MKIINAITMITICLSLFLACESNTVRTVYVPVTGDTDVATENTPTVEEDVKVTDNDSTEITEDDSIAEDFEITTIDSDVVITESEVTDVEVITDSDATVTTCGDGIKQPSEVCEIGMTEYCNGIDTIFDAASSDKAECKKDCSGWDLKTCNYKASVKCPSDNKFCHIRGWLEGKDLRWSDPASEVSSWTAAMTYCESIGGILPTIDQLKQLSKCQLMSSCDVSEKTPQMKYDDDKCWGCKDLPSGGYSWLEVTANFWSTTMIPDSNFGIAVWTVDMSNGGIGAGVINKDLRSVQCVGK